MAYRINDKEFNAVIEKLSKKYRIYAPCLLQGHGTFSDTDIIGYSQIQESSQIVFDKKSMYSFKETILPISETLFYFTDDDMKETKKKFENAIVFLRNCDLHGLKRLDDIYQSGSMQDFYFERLRSNVKFIVIGCDTGFESCFCESTGTDEPAGYDAYIYLSEKDYILDSRFDELTEILTSAEKIQFEPKKITNTLKVEIPDNIPDSIIKSPVWDEYDARCISCGRCTFVCPTCSCFTMQDIFYEDNKNAGERRRVWASCMVDGYTDIAGGICYRESKAERMRFRVLHKISDHKKRHGQNMCVGCGRCDDVCPEYISFSSCIGKVLKEGSNG
jgi:anaerobic sulfite reductase subunit A